MTSLTKSLAWMVLCIAVALAQKSSAPSAASGSAGQPIRLIQAQNTDQQSAIRNLVEELQKSAPQLFQNIGGQGRERVAIALPPELLGAQRGSPNAANSAPSPVPLFSPMQPTSFASPAPVSGTPAPNTAAPPPPSASAAIAADTENNEPSKDTEHDSTPLSFVINALFQETDSSKAHATVDAAASHLPFGLHFGSAIHESRSQTASEIESDWSDAEASASSSGAESAHGDSSAYSNSERESGLDSPASNVAVSLAVVIGLSLCNALAAMA